jgi:hypothetical protein
MYETAMIPQSQAFQLRRGARRLRYALTAGLALLLLAVLAALFLPNGAAGGIQATVNIRGVGVPYPAAMVLAASLSVLLGIGLFRLVRLLRRLESGELFSPAVTRELRAFTWYALLAALVSTVSPVLVSLLGLRPPDATSRLELAVDSADLWLLLFTGTMFLVARLLDEANRVAEDHRQIV